MKPLQGHGLPLRMETLREFNTRDRGSFQENSLERLQTERIQTQNPFAMNHELASREDQMLFQQLTNLSN